ncbi:hypothetical protein AB0C38_04635 [Amycolatopsis sp. NPDC048633]|uniref:hypothetical protein n=1 Tax=Amycolatopsis sp. NPDC048633 TaxID=3157095 RepID=UPI0033F1AC6A
MANDETAPRLSELLKDARAAVEHIEEARKHYAAGNQQAAVDVVALTPYKLNQALGDIDELLKYWSGRGIVPGAGD